MEMEDCNDLLELTAQREDSKADTANVLWDTRPSSLGKIILILQLEGKDSIEGIVDNELWSWSRYRRDLSRSCSSCPKVENLGFEEDLPDVQAQEIGVQYLEGRLQ